MAYLTKQEYASIGYTADENFTQNEQIAEKLVDSICHYYDQYLGSANLAADISSSDTIACTRAKFFKKAMAVQTAFVSDNGIQSISDVAKDCVQSFTVGHTTINNGTSNLASMVAGNSGVCQAAYDLLIQFGLLYTGVGHL